MQSLAIQTTQQTDSYTLAFDMDMEIRNRIRPLIRVLNGTQFGVMMETLPQHKDRFAIECIQTCIKASKGLGKYIRIEFAMQLDFEECVQIKKDLLEN